MGPENDPRTVRRRLRRWVSGVASDPVEDLLAVEEPLEIRLHDVPIVVTMRTPGDDFPLAAGFLFTEGIIGSSSDLGTIRHCENTLHPSLRNVVNVTLAEGVRYDAARLQRNFYATSSCGVCGKAAIEHLRTTAPQIISDLRVRAGTLQGLVETLRRSQSVFEKTGGLHAAGLFDPEGRMDALREDVGRHNAVDKAIGAMLLDGAIPLRDRILLVSGRASFEILQKALMASIPVVCAVSAPSSLAVEFAEENRMTLVGFLRGGEMNVYTDTGRILP